MSDGNWRLATYRWAGLAVIVGISKINRLLVIELGEIEAICQVALMTLYPNALIDLNGSMVQKVYLAGWYLSIE